MSHLVVGATQLEREDWLKVFALEQDLAFQSIREVDGMRQRSLLDYIVDAGRKNQTKVLFNVSLR